MNSLAKNTFMRIIILTVVFFFSVVYITVRLQQNDLEAKAEQLQGQIEAAQAEIDELQAEIDRPFDDEYVAKIAHEKLGLRYPHEIIFYGGSGN